MARAPTNRSVILYAIFAESKSGKINTLDLLCAAPLVALFTDITGTNEDEKFKDQEIIKMADKLKVSMIFTGQRLFFH